jgi:hypothetical protein
MILVVIIRKGLKLVKRQKYLLSLHFDKFFCPKFAVFEKILHLRLDAKK